MSRILGLHVQRGQLDAVETLFVEADIKEGVAVKQIASDTVAPVTAATDPVYGITGGRRAGVGMAVVRHGKIWMELDAGVTPTLTGIAYITADGKATDVNTGTPIGYFTSDEVGTNGVQNLPNYTNEVRCAQVFVDL